MQINFLNNISRPRWTRNWSTRRKVILFLVLALVLPPAAFVAANDIFSDVPSGHSFHDDVNAIYGAGITKGTTATTFSPEDPATRGQIAAFLHRGLPRVAFKVGATINLTDTHQDLAVVTINTGGAPGGKGFVKLDASLVAFSTETAGCPCEVQFAIVQDSITFISSRSGYVTVYNKAAGVDSNVSGSLTFVVPVPTASTLTFRLIARKSSGTPQQLPSKGELAAVYIPFGSTGGDTLDPPSMGTLAVSEAEELKAQTDKSNKQ